MNAFLLHEGKAALLLAAFWLCWRLLLQRETFHRFNRVVLLGMVAAALVLPLCVITIDKTVFVGPMESVPMVESAEAAETSGTWWQWPLFGLYTAGTLAVLMRLIRSILHIRRLVRDSAQRPQEDGSVLCINDSVQAPFSWMKWIVLSREDLDSPAVLSHEKAHVALHHSFDLMLVDLVTVFQWFNPAVWLLRQDLRALHEYEADERVLQGGADAREYQYLLVRKAMTDAGYSIANSFSHSTLKGRIGMMCRRPSRRIHLARILFVVPLVALSLTLTARTSYTYVGKSQELPNMYLSFRPLAPISSLEFIYLLKEDGVMVPLSEAEMMELFRSNRIASVQVHAPLILISTNP